jgi:ATP-binding cassette subfamily C protein CydC
VFASTMSVLHVGRSHHVTRYFAISLFFGVLAGGASVGLLALAGWFIAMSALSGTGLIVGFSFLFPSAGVQALAFGRTALRYVGRIIGHDATLRLDAGLKESIFDTAVATRREASVASTGALLHAVTSDAEIAESSLLRILDPVVTYAGVAVGGCCVIAATSPRLALVVTAGAFVLGAAVILPGWLSSLGPGKNLAKAESLARQDIIDGLEGLDELLSLGASNRGAERVEETLATVDRERHRLRLLATLARAFGIVVAGITVLLVAALSSGALGQRPVAVASAATITLATLGIVQLADPVTRAVREVGRTRAVWGRLSTTLNLEARSTISQNAPTPSGMNEGILSSIAVRGLCIDRGRGLIIEELSFTAFPGATVLVRGSSGAGKSSLLAALNGQLRSSAEELQLVGKVITLPQHPYIFRGTVEDNLRLAAPNASDAMLEEMVNLVGLGEVLPAPALQQPLGSSGRALSGGQSRRLTIAQGLLAQPDVLVADEPTEGLDPAATREMLMLLRYWNPAMTLVLAMHELQIKELGWSPDVVILLDETSPRALVSDHVQP